MPAVGGGYSRTDINGCGTSRGSLLSTACSACAVPAEVQIRARQLTEGGTGALGTTVLLASMALVASVPPSNL